MNLLINALEITVANGFLQLRDVCICCCTCISLSTSLNPETSPSVRALLDIELKKRKILVPSETSLTLRKKVLTSFNGFVPPSSSSLSCRKITINRDEIVGCHMTPSNACLLVIERENLTSSSSSSGSSSGGERRNRRGDRIEENIIAYLLDTSTLRKTYIDDIPLIESDNLQMELQNGQVRKLGQLKNALHALKLLHAVQWVSERQFIGLSDQPLAQPMTEQTPLSAFQSLSCFFNIMEVQQTQSGAEVILMKVIELRGQCAASSITNIQPAGPPEDGQYHYYYHAMNASNRECVIIDLHRKCVSRLFVYEKTNTFCKLNDHMTLFGIGGKSTSTILLGEFASIGARYNVGNGRFRIHHQFLASVKTNGNGYSFYVTAARSGVVEEFDIRRLSCSVGNYDRGNGFDDYCFNGILSYLPYNERYCKRLPHKIRPTDPVAIYGDGAKSSRIIDFAVARDGRIATRHVKGTKSLKTSFQGYVRGKIFDVNTASSWITRDTSDIFKCSPVWAVTKDLLSYGVVDSAYMENTIWFCSGQNRNGILVCENNWRLSFVESSPCELDVERDLYNVFSYIQPPTST